MKFKVSLNGTKVNPYHKFGLTQNPFPQYAKYEYANHLLHIATLGGDQIPDTDHIRKHLEGYSKEFIELCCERFKPGEYVTFEVQFPGE